MKLATWNVNSISVRLPQVLSWLVDNDVDVLAVQETKVMDAGFPEQAFTDIGYTVSFSGQKTYNGVAIISKKPMSDPLKDNPFFSDEARRFLAVTIDDVRLVNVYVPNGQSVDSDKYQYKLAWLDGFLQFLKAELLRYPNLVVVGDFNIAPADEDVYSPEHWFGSVLVSDAERAAFQSMLALGLVDLLRHMNPTTPQYTWWDYRQGAFRRNHGLRIDHVLCSPALLATCHEVGVDVEPRRAERPSDHAPVWVLIR
ncbi:MAG: exodeoxyribonuclease III [Gammaproteobacteria bacterium]|nr:exodeoxyribonuclease III [Gammaproteobacteria bacterium]